MVMRNLLGYERRSGVYAANDDTAWLVCFYGAIPA